MKWLQPPGILLIIGFFSWGSVYCQPATTKRIDSLMTALYARGQFKGSIIVAVEGRLLYRNAFGKTRANGEITPASSYTIASLSKAFTSMIIMMLAEQHRLTYDDPITQYLQELNKFSNGITIRHLLTHTSGIPDVGDLGIDDAQLTNEKALTTLAKLKSNFREPGQEYEYSNTGYLLLATIAERITGMKFRDVLRREIFDPLGMTNTSLSGQTAGMGEIHSTVDDLLKWEESFYTAKLVRQSTLVEAFTPFPVKEGTSTYGFGWNIAPRDGDKFIWHTGNADGFRAFIGRTLSGHIAVIMLTEGDCKRMEIDDAIVNIIKGKPYSLPRLPVIFKLYNAIIKDGLEKGIALYDSLRSHDFQTYDFSEGPLNSLGYKLLDEHQTVEAIAIFKLITVAYPQSSNAFDSLGEAYYRSGDTRSAICCYEKAIALDPANLSSINMLKKLNR